MVFYHIVALFAVLYPARSWIALTGTVGLSWLVLFKYWATGVWKEFVFFPAMEYVLPLILSIAERFRYPPRFASPTYGVPQSVSAIIPDVNEGERLSACLEAIHLPVSISSEIIVVDGESTDDTCLVAQSDLRVTLVKTGKGRGIQIAEGVDRSSGDLVVIVHADTLLVNDGIERIYRYCSGNRAGCGGSVAAIFGAPGFRYAFITALNIARAQFSGISFGDQVHFFRREALCGALPRVWLMEDIEISLLLKERGPVALLPCLATSSTRRWQKKACAGNMMIVIYLAVLYLVKRRSGMLEGDNADFYRMYYGKT